LVTRNDVARLAKVSPAVVSYVINNSNYVSEAKRKAVLSAIEELNYIPNQNAKNLRQGRTNMIAVVRGSQLNDIFNDLLFYLENIANSRGYHVVLSTVLKTEDYYATDDFIMTLISRHYDAVFVANSSLTEQQLNRLAKSTKVLLYVTRDYYTLNPSISQVVPHYRMGVKNMINRLIEAGHRRIAILPNLSYPMNQYTISNHRFAGYMDAFMDHRLPLNMQYIPASCRNVEDVRRCIERLFDPAVTPEPPTAICADEPFVIASVLKQLTSMGFSVPEDVSLGCFSDSTLATVTTPELTSVGFDSYQFAQTAMDMMEELIHGKSSRSQIIDLKYFERGSIAPAL
jgi:DNA-binding LacI/PurR family transcriptional regulator